MFLVLPDRKDFLSSEYIFLVCFFLVCVLKESTWWILPVYPLHLSGPADSFLWWCTCTLCVLYSHVDGFWTGPVDILKWNNEGIDARKASVPGHEWEQCLAVRLDERVPAKDRAGFSEQVWKNSLNVSAVVGLLCLAVTVWWRLGLEKCSVLLQETCMSFWTLDLHIGQSQGYP